MGRIWSLEREKFGFQHHQIPVLGLLVSLFANYEYFLTWIIGGMIFILQGLGNYMKAFITVKLISNIIGITILQCCAHFCCQNICSLVEKTGLRCGYVLSHVELSETPVSTHSSESCSCLERVHTLRIGFHFSTSFRLLDSSLAFRFEAQLIILSTLIR